MDAIILAGGKGTRMLPLTQNMPKPLLKVRGRSILEWSLLTLRPAVSRVLVVVHYLQEQIMQFMDQQTIFERYFIVEQCPEPLGTGHAVQCCAPHLKSDEFIVTNGDDLYSSAALMKLAQTRLGILSVERDDPARWGVLVKDDNGNLARIHEKPPSGYYSPPVQVNAGVYKLNSSIYTYDLPLSSRGEYELTDYISWLAQNNQVTVVPTDFWLPLGNPDDLENAQTVELENVLFI